MSDVIISVENLGKKYRLSHQAEGQRYTALRDVLANKVKGLLGNQKSESGHRKSVEDFWALKDVSFEVKRGDVVGVIGRNGAGKSTLLKVLSRITEPTEGRVHLKGRVASLLEVGTGFHPELTGRENVFLNGAILGMSRAEVRQKFDEIVAFAEVEKFLDTPVKRYSSGMYVRLAFAVAAHLEPEILIVDEVLAVGDAEFQKKCLGKMKDVSSGGRTVLFVSHNMPAVRSLCKSCILLERGRVAKTGLVGETLAHYHHSESPSARNSRVSKLSENVFLARLEATPLILHQNGPMALEIEIGARIEEVISDLALLIYASSGERIAIIDLRSPTGNYRIKPNSNLRLQTKIDNLPFIEGSYNFGLWVNSTSIYNSFMDLITFTILPGEHTGDLIPREPQHRGFIELKTTTKAISGAQ